ncbi:MAG TPA: hypothetical protein ENI23_06840 [bacterium]|nr:hypothetical protein [bacterium]
MKRVKPVEVTKLPSDNAVFTLDISAYTEDKELLSATVVSVTEIESGAAVSGIASIENVSGNLILLRLQNGLETTSYKCTIQANTNSPEDIYEIEVVLNVVPWHKDNQQFTKQPGGTRVESFDFENLLGGSDDGSGNMITSLSVQAVNHVTGDPANIIQPAGIRGSLGKFRLFGGVSGDTYKCTAIATGNNPTRSYGEVFFLNVIDY